MQNKNKKLLTLDDLYNFCVSQNKMYSFDSKDSGYQIAVQIPANFEVDKNTEDDTLLFCTVKIMHSGENRNHSNVTDEALIKASKNLAYKPVLANFMEYVDEKTGETLKDFTAHDMILNDDGTVTYLEKQIGCFTADEPYFEVEEETGHNFLYGKCAIPRSYSDAVSIIERKGGTKVSVELLINEMQYNSKSKVLELTDIIIQGLTCLGKNPETLEDVGEGMRNARLDIIDFSVENNSMQFSKDEKLIEVLDKLNTTLSKFNINDQNNGQNENQEEGGNKNMDKFNELLSKYGKTIEDVDFDYEGLTDEELDQKFESVFGEVQSDDADDVDNPEDNSSDDEPSDDEETPKIDEVEGESDETSNNEPEIKEDNACGGGSKKKKKCSEESMSRTYEISHDEIRYSLYQLLMPYEEAENDCYWIMDVFDTYFVYQSYTGKTFGQKYTKDNDVVAFDGERYELFLEYLTASEMAELKDMRSNYSSIVEQLNAYKYAENIADKLSIFEDEGYSAYLDTDEFKNLMSEDTLKKFTKEELIEKADAALGKAVKESKTYSFNFSNEDASGKKKNKIGVFSDFDTAKDQNPYGDYFKSIN